MDMYCGVMVNKPIPRTNKWRVSLIPIKCLINVALCQNKLGKYMLLNLKQLKAKFIYIVNKISKPQKQTSKIHIFINKLLVFFLLECYNLIIDNHIIYIIIFFL